MKEIHPLKRKSIKPSSSTVRGMLPGAQFRALDAAMQSLRTAGLQLDWSWRDKNIGWVCEGRIDDITVCELQPTQEPLLGVIRVQKGILKKLATDKSLPKKLKIILDSPVESTSKESLYEIPLASTAFRDIFSEFTGYLADFLQADLAASAE